MIIRPTVARPLTNLSLNNTPNSPNRARLTSPIDSFSPATGLTTSPTASLTPPTTAAPIASTSSASSGIGGFFSNLWSGIKQMFGSLLGQADQSLQQQAPSLTSQLGSMVSGLASSAVNWFSGLLSSWSGKLEQ